MAKEFPPEKVRAIVGEVAELLKQKGESVSVAETVRFRSLGEIGNSGIQSRSCGEKKTEGDPQE